MTGLRLRHVADINPATPDFDRLSDDAEVTFLPLEAVWPGVRLDATRTRPKREVSTGYTRYLDGDVLVPKITPTFEADRSTIARSRTGAIGAATTELHIVRPSPHVDARYIDYLVSSQPFLLGGKAEMTGVAGQQRVPDGWLRDFPVPLSDVAHQRVIANFLDVETARIDALTAKKRRLYDLLLERSQRRLSLLAQRGLEDCGTRYSGHEWLGSIPSHWSVARLVFEARLESGHTPSRTKPELWENCDTPWITLNDVGYLADVEFVDETINLISSEGLAASSARVLPTGTVVLSRDATIGRCGILAKPMATSQHFANWVCGERLHPRYLWLVFRTLMQDHFHSLTDGATLRTIGMPDIRDFVIPLPPLKEQAQIVALGEQVRRLAAQVTTKLDRQIELLEERRRALITAAVTGELSVPGVAAA